VIFGHGRAAALSATVAIVATNGDGGAERRITRAPRGYEDDQPDWSPDGTRLAFTRCPARADGRCHVFVVNAAGTRLTRLGPSCNGPLPSCEDRRLLVT
jgi:Tol biopolymer transport system component